MSNVHDQFSPSKVNDTEFELKGASGQTANTSVHLSAQNSKQSEVHIESTTTKLIITTDPTVTPTNAKDCVIYFDSTNGAAKLQVKAKSANGTAVAGTIALS